MILERLQDYSFTYQIHKSDRGLGHTLWPLGSMGTALYYTVLYNDIQGNGFDLGTKADKEILDWFIAV